MIKNKMAEKNEKIEYPEVGVGAVIINKDGEILLAKCPKWKNKYTIFGGHLEYGEKLEEAIKREVNEETGLIVEIIDNLSFNESVFNSEYKRKAHFIFCYFLCSFTGNKENVKTNDEFEEKYIWAKPEEALKLDIQLYSKQAIERFIKYKDDKDYLNSWKRCQADFENYRKMQSQMQKDSLRYAISDIASQIFPVLDNFNASLDHVPEDEKKNPWVQGLTYIQRQLEQVLKDNGIEEIETKEGDIFNPEIHEAIENHQEEEKEEHHKIKKIVSKGYKMGDRILRPAKVIVK